MQDPVHVLGMQCMGAGLGAPAIQDSRVGGACKLAFNKKLKEVF